MPRLITISGFKISCGLSDHLTVLVWLGWMIVFAWRVHALNSYHKISDHEIQTNGFICNMYDKHKEREQKKQIKWLFVLNCFYFVCIFSAFWLFYICDIIHEVEHDILSIILFHLFSRRFLCFCYVHNINFDYDTTTSFTSRPIIYRIYRRDNEQHDCEKQKKFFLCYAMLLVYSEFVRHIVEQTNSKHNIIMYSYMRM